MEPRPASGDHVEGEALEGRRDRDTHNAAVESLKSRGYTLLPAFLPAGAVDDVVSRAAQVFRAPAAGANGHHVVDHARKVLNPCTGMGGQILDLLLHEALLDIVEGLLDGPCVLAEASIRLDRGVGYEYFPMHCDFYEGWSLGSQPRLVAEALRRPIAVGCLLYLHDTTEGAFCYCEGSHALGIPRHSQLEDCPAELRTAVLRRKTRVSGRRGDLVLFDPRGFHGPDQPSRASRSALLFHFYGVDTFGLRQVSPLPVYTSDLGRLSARQTRVLGVGAEYMFSPEQYVQHYTGNRIQRTPAYGLAVRLIANAFLPQHVANVLLPGSLVRRLRGLWQRRS